MVAPDEKSPDRKDPLGLSLPTPVEKLPSLSTEKTTLWVKRDDLTHPLYGGNKARKLAAILMGYPEPRTIVTVGAAGSHHVLATALFGGKLGHRVEGVLVPQPNSPHVEENLRAGLHAGLVVRRVSSMLGAAVRLVIAWLTGKTVLWVGGSTVLGAAAYADAAHELARQVEAGLLPRPDVVVVTLGSGGTMAGLVVGLEELGWDTILIGVVVTEPPWAAGPLMRALARRVAKVRGGRVSFRHVRIERGYLGEGYGHATEAGERALRDAARAGLLLDQTYTAKCFAATRDVVAKGDYENVLYWHTLSSAPLAPLLDQAPPLPEAERELLR